MIKLGCWKTRPMNIILHCLSLFKLMIDKAVLFIISFISDQEIKRPSKQQEPICPVASKMQNGHMLKKSTITSQTAETHGACGKPFRPSLTTSPRHRPVMRTHPSPMHSTTFIHGLKCRMTHLHKNCPHLPTTGRFVCLQPT